jgi:hypothetical protein
MPPLAPQFIVRVEKKPESSFAGTMNSIRSWLDHRKIQPASFQARCDRPERGWI